jgi:spore coat polysaccharide biosynthesis predicted glycosyltransferase SpsG
MKILFRTRGGKFYGWGNVARLAEVAFFFHKKNHEVTFIYEGDKYISEFLKKYKFKKIKLPEDIPLVDEKNKLKNITNSSVVFMEMLDINLELQKLYKKKTKKFVILDDLLDKNYISHYVICCQNIRNIKNKVLLPKDAKLLVGSNYFPFNSNFKKNKYSQKKLNKKVDNILIFLGGGDYSPAYIKIAHAIKKFRFKKITFILAKSNYKTLKIIIKKIDKRIILKNGTNNAANEFYMNDVAIVGGGYTKFESAIMMTPCITISTQWHQLELAENFKKDSASDHLGHFSRISIKKISSALTKIIKMNTRIKILKNYKRIINLNGLKKILNETKITLN